LATIEKGKLVEWFFLNTRMLLIYDTFEVQEIELASKEVVRSYNLQEIEGFEISEEAEEDKVVAFVVEKDVQLLGVSCVDAVHIFEFSEEDDSNSLTHVIKIDKINVTKLIFVQYILTMIQNEGSELNVMCYDLESESITAETKIERSSESPHILIESGEECLYFVNGTKLGKIDI
jgi:hypothetical protein